jgi:hypothetical protein
MEAQQTRIDELQKSHQEKFAVADALIASLEQQAGYFTNMFAAMDTASRSMR